MWCSSAPHVRRRHRRPRMGGNRVQQLCCRPTPGGLNRERLQYRNHNAILGANETPFVRCHGHRCWCSPPAARGQSPWVLTWSDEFDRSVDRPHPKWTFDIGRRRLGQSRTGELHQPPGECRPSRTACSSSVPARKTTPAPTALPATTPRPASNHQGLFTLPATAASKPARSKFLTGRESGRRSGCSAPTSPPPAGRLAARSTSWRTSARSRRSIHGTIHGPGYSGGSGIGFAPSPCPTPGRFADGFPPLRRRVAARPDRVLGGRPQVYKRITQSEDLPPGSTWVFDRPFFLLLNLAIGGNWPGDPDSTTTFPQTLLSGLCTRLRAHPAPSSAIVAHKFRTTCILAVERSPGTPRVKMARKPEDNGHAGESRWPRRRISAFVVRSPPGELAAGAALSETALSREIGVSRTPAPRGHPPVGGRRLPAPDAQPRQRRR